MNTSGSTRSRYFIFGGRLSSGAMHENWDRRVWRLAVRERRLPSANATDDRERTPENGVTLSLRLSSRVSVVCPRSLFSALFIFSTASQSRIFPAQVTCQPGEISERIGGKGIMTTTERLRVGRKLERAKTRAYEEAAGFFSPHLFIRESKVVGLTPRSSAAPSGPLIFQLAFSRITRRLSRSWRWSSASVRNSGCGASLAGAVDRAGKGWLATGNSKSSAPPRARIAARSITLRNS